ncbi:MAG TPA: hypothetical protein VMW94_07525 [Actinomycetes bacterium]|nr:hypothetical protein [Actinomycetes bacterium]
MTPPRTPSPAPDDLASELRGWFTGRLPESWFVATPEVVVDREEVTVVGALADPADPATPEAEQAAARRGRAAAFREETRSHRIAMAQEVEHRFGRSVAWGVDVGGERILFTRLAVPVMTRLRQPERQVLDVLVGAGVARSRADALAWCVRLVGRNADEWLAELRQALDEVERVRSGGPGSQEG